MISLLGGIVFGGGLGTAIVTLFLANAALRRHRAFALRVEPQGRLAASRFNHISHSARSNVAA